MQKFEDFNEFIEMEAIATYLRSFGYKAQVNNDDLTVQVQDLDASIKIICNWHIAREFIKVRSQA
jgi:hypothetical protein